MDNKFYLGLITGLILAILVTIIGRYTSAGILYKYYNAIEQCEAELPRSQRCVITAIPEMDDEE